MSSLPLGAFLSFLPEECIPVIAVTAGFALVFGQRRLAIYLMQLLGLLLILPLIFGPLLDKLPLEVLVFILLAIILGTFKSIIMLLLGREAGGQFIGSLAADFFKWMIFAPFRTCRKLSTMVSRWFGS